jgi:hypothetical protein
MVSRSFLAAIALVLAQVPMAWGQSAGQPVLDDATLLREYQAYRASVEGMRLYRVSYIRVATESEARDLIARIRSGAPFPDLARERSTHKESAASGGDLGSHAGCRWAKATREMLDTLTRGQTWPQPVKGTHGWGVYRLESVATLEPRTFERYKSELLSGQFAPECPWVPPVTVAPAPAAPAAAKPPVPAPPAAVPGLTRN